MRYRNQTIKISRYTILGIIVTIALGVLSHFVFDWTKQNRIAAFFVPVNESTWEHLKMIAVPMLLYSIFECLMIGASLTNYMIAKAVSILFGMFLVMSLFYTYTGVIGQHYLVVDIVVFVISVIGAYILSYVILNKRLLHSSIFQPLGMILIVAIIICFMWFTYSPPKISLFYDASVKGYGF